MNFISYIVTILLFIGPCCLAFLGWHVEGYNVNLLSSFYPAFYILIFCHFRLNIYSRVYNSNNRRNTLFVIFLIMYFIFFKVVTDRTISTNLLFNSICLPVLYASFFTYFTSKKHKIKIRKLVILLYIINSLIAIYERLSLQNLFSLDLAYKDSDFSIENDLYADLFRSNAFLGHPLTNALITAIIMGFIIMSNYKTLKKFVLYILGFIALMCFNARGAILLSSLFFIIYVFHFIFERKAKSSTKLLTIIFVALCIVLVIFLLNEGYGGRFFEKDVSEDSSILARIEVWNVFNKCSLFDFIWGSDDILGIALKALGKTHIENWLVLSILSVGIIVTILTILNFIPLFKMFLKDYNNYQKLFLLGIFLSIASTNNSLACGVPAISVFFVCAYAFSDGQRKCIK